MISLSDLCGMGRKARNVEARQREREDSKVARLRAKILEVCALALLLRDARPEEDGEILR